MSSYWADARGPDPEWVALWRSTVEKVNNTIRADAQALVERYQEVYPDAKISHVEVEPVRCDFRDESLDKYKMRYNLRIVLEDEPLDKPE